MSGIDELSRVIGRLESSIQTLFIKNDVLCDEVKALRKIVQGRRLKDSAKIIFSGFLGGFTAVLAKMAIWGK